MTEQILGISAELGLKKNEIKAYEAMLRHGSATAAEIADAASITRPKVYEALKSLEQQGFCLATGDAVKRFRPVRPEDALQELTRRRAIARSAATDRDQDLAERLLGFLPEVTPDETALGHGFMRVGSGADQTMEMFGDLVGRSAVQLDLVMTSPLIVEGDESEARIFDALDRGVAVRAIYDKDLLREAPKRGKQMLAAGAQVRTSDQLPLKMSLRDHGSETLISMVARSQAEVAAFAVCITHPELCAPFQVLFNRQWRRAIPC